jgi:hypothetical protein
MGGNFDPVLRAAGVAPQDLRLAGEALTASLAEGTPPEEALQAALRAVQSHGKVSSAQAIPLSDVDQAAEGLATGRDPQTVVQSAGLADSVQEAGTQALLDALAQGASPEAALAAAQQAQAAQAALIKAQRVPVSDRDRALGQLSRPAESGQGLPQAGAPPAEAGD